MFNFIPIEKQFLKARQKIENVRFRQNNAELVNSITFVTLAEKGDIDEVTATEHVELFSPWASGIAYTIGALRQYNGELYRCVQAHTSQDDWTPDITTSLWSKTGNPLEEYPEWSQPIGAHDAYNLGAKVTYGDKKWISTVDANIWEPGVYGWDEATND